MTELANLESDMLRVLYGISPVRSNSPQPRHFRDKPPVSVVADKYKIQSGDTLTGIAKRSGTTVAELLNLNPHLRKNPNLIRSGETIRLREGNRGAPAPMPPKEKSAKARMMEQAEFLLGDDIRGASEGMGDPVMDAMFDLGTGGVAAGGLKLANIVGGSLKEAMAPMAARGSMTPHIDPTIDMAHGMSRAGQKALPKEPLRLVRDRRYGRDRYPKGTGLDLNHPNQEAAFKQWLDDMEAARFAPDPLSVATRRGY